MTLFSVGGRLSESVPLRVPAMGEAELRVSTLHWDHHRATVRMAPSSFDRSEVDEETGLEANAL